MMRRRFFGINLNSIILLVVVYSGRLAGFINRHKNKIRAVAVTIALLLGIWGWTIERPPADAWGVLDNVFRTLQLITLQFPSQYGSLPTPLQIARFAVPIVSVVASFQILVASLTRSARLAMVPHIAGHVVVCGFAGLTEKALSTLAERGLQVVVVIPGISKQQRTILESDGLTVIDADPTQNATLRSLNLSHAAAIFLLSNDDLANINIALGAVKAADARPNTRPPLLVALKIDREDLAVELDMALDNVSRRHGVYYRRLSPSRENLRLELSRFAPALSRVDMDVPSHVLVVGLLGNWRQIVSEIILTVQDHPDKRPLLTFIVDKAEAEALERWRKSYPQLDLVVDISALRRDAAAILPFEQDIENWRKTHALPQLAVVLREDAEAVVSTLALRRPGTPFGTERVPVLVHQSTDDRLLSSLGHITVVGHDLTNLTAIGNLVRAETIERILDRTSDEMAAALHASYVGSTKRLGAGSQTALQIWENLPENLRNANRASVDHAPILLAAAGYKLVPRFTLRSEIPSAVELETMAKVEHRRWMADRIERGWRYAPVRDDNQMLHPDLVPYDALTDDGKEKDRNAVKTLLSVLRNAGFSFARISNDDCRPDMSAPGSRLHV
jgi:hypothetical protein